MNNEMTYNFDPEKAYDHIIKSFMEYCEKNNLEKRVVLGISGGKDSTVMASMFSRALGPENVYGVMMPRDEQSDIADSREVIDLTKINSLTIDIGDAFHSIVNSIENNTISVSKDTRINLSPRLRMASLYAVAQSVNGIVLCTDNLSERKLGYFTLFGDGAGSYCPFKNTTVTEVRKIGMWLGLPERLVMKKPGDGLQPIGDEERMGISYDTLDDFMRTGQAKDGEMIKRATERCLKNRFKLEIVDIPGPKDIFEDRLTCL